MIEGGFAGDVAAPAEGAGTCAWMHGETRTGCPPVVSATGPAT